MWYHLVGISGISMRAIAQILESQGHKVTGSDLKLSGHSAANIVDGIDAVIYTSAVTPNSAGWVEIQAAKDKKIKLIKRGEMLAELVKDYKVIAVSGTHGKTTTTSMIGLTLIEAGLDPLVIVGEEVADLGGTVRFGKGEWAVVEACEYDRNFLNFYPQIAVITNVEEEHLDHYPGGLPDLEATFAKFAGQVAGDGTIIICGDDQNTLETAKQIKNTKAKIISYGLDKSNNINDLPFELSIPGDHNRRNALATIAIAKVLGINEKVVESAIEDFHGADRRFQIKGEKNGVVVIDDYGHHPTEIAALLSGVKEKYPDKKIYTVFWPHQYKRTKVFLKKFPPALEIADKIIVKEIFFVPGRDSKEDVSGQDIVDLINQDESNKAEFIDDDAKILDKLVEDLSPDWVLVTVGIPPVYKIADAYLGEKNDKC
ncbi:MAG: UDP-N-acetylmuramate--L-alanine ligase [Candidatus Berkelbacteria bacterium]|nr:UDP-N-acetylmuramate--L-alanine ligase [Candidatus Berkelbacteria bacterium]